MTRAVPRSGLWPSHISAAEANSAASSPQYPQRIDGRLTWIEARPMEGGRNVLVIEESDGTQRTLTPDGFNVRTRVYEYGGRSHAFFSDSGEWHVAFVNFSDQAVYRQPLFGGDARRVTTDEYGAWRFADLQSLPEGRGLIAVAEIHQSVGEPRNLLVHLSLGDAAVVTELHAGPDFVAMPTISEDGENLAWIQWNHPNMQWDQSELWSGRIACSASGEVRLSEVVLRAGGVGRSVWQPLYLRDGSLVFAMDDETKTEPDAAFWQIFREVEGRRDRLTHGEREFAEPFWVAGERRFVQCDDQRLLAIGTDAEGDVLVYVPLDGSGPSEVLASMPMMLQLSADGEGGLLAASGAATPVGIYSWDDDAGFRRRVGPVAEIPENQISVGQPVFCPARDGARIHTWFYPPTHAEYRLEPGEAPPLVVKVHGGPTAAARKGFQAEVQFWTNRGFGFADINYRGSTGFGRSYRQALLGRWGDLDIDDVSDVVRHLAETGRASADGLFIRGGSAGGYVVLRALTRDPDIWSGGACRYGIGNLGTLAATTHKFEARYVDGLLGMGWTKGMENEPGNPYHDRSPIFFIDRMKAPVVLFQGSEDKVVPPEVSREMVATLEASGIPTEYHEYEGEGHGFRKAENRIHALEAELRFFQTVLSAD